MAKKRQMVDRTPRREVVYAVAGKCSVCGLRPPVMGSVCGICVSDELLSWYFLSESVVEPKEVRSCATKPRSSSETG